MKLYVAFTIPYHLLPYNHHTEQYTDLQVQELSGNNCTKSPDIITFSTIRFRFCIVYLQNGLIKHPLHTYSSLCHNTHVDFSNV